MQDLKIGYTLRLEKSSVSTDPKVPLMSDNNHLVKVKTALAEKYERLSRNAKSVTKTRQFSYRAVRYRRQVAQLLHDSE